MTILRAALLEFLVCYHVIGGAVLFRRFRPRESPWLGFFVPMLALISLLNFVEHFFALPSLGWLLPLTAGGTGWAMLRSRGAWEGLRLPSILFVVAFTYCLIIRGLHPEIPYWTEGLADLARVLDFCLGDKLPPTDSWLPPYPQGGYYTFQHYGASVLMRLFMLDVGTGYNVSYVLLDALICLAAAAIAHAVGGKAWMAAAMLVLVAASFTGGGAIMMLFGSYGFDPLLAYDLHHGWADPHHNPLWSLLAADPYQTRTRLFTPGNGIYMPEFHANLGGHFLTLLALLAVVEVARETKSNLPWTLLIVVPVLSVITDTWVVPIVAAFCAGGVLVALLASRRPENPHLVFAASAIVIVLLWPTVMHLTAEAVPQAFRVTLKEERTWPWLFVEQWWPVYLPWLLLLFVWRKLTFPARLLHGGIPLLLIFFEIFTIGDREPTLEKIWSGLFGAGLVVFWSLVFTQRAWPFRVATFAIILISAIALVNWWSFSGKGIARGDDFFRLQGDVILHDNPVKRRLLQVAARLHGATILTGKSNWGYGLAPALAGFSENRCFVGWTYPEELAGHADEAHARAQFGDDFYAGKVADPLPYLSAHDIAAVLIWPDDQISNEVLGQLKTQLAPDFDYIDCQSDGPDNAGLFLRRPKATPRSASAGYWR
jgi:hypothetical protein